MVYKMATGGFAMHAAMNYAATHLSRTHAYKKLLSIYTGIINIP